jgi:hypothetical protein
LGRKTSYIYPNAFLFIGVPELGYLFHISILQSILLFLANTLLSLFLFSFVGALEANISQATVMPSQARWALAATSLGEHGHFGGGYNIC